MDKKRLEEIRQDIMEDVHFENDIDELFDYIKELEADKERMDWLEKHRRNINLITKNSDTVILDWNYEGKRCKQYYEPTLCQAIDKARGK